MCGGLSVRTMPGLILSCEHASARVPEDYRSAFSSREAREALTTHRGFDIGALALARGLKKDVESLTNQAVPLAAGGMTRLLIDLNRSPHHRGLFSPFSATLPKGVKQKLRSYHQEYHDALRALVVRTRGQVLHVAVHSFVPTLDGETRSTDVGILFDPSRKPEVLFAKRCQAHLHQATGLIVHRNAPYRGIADGLPTLLRREYSARKYVGIELEVSQRITHARGRNRVLKALRIALVRVLAEALED